MVLRRMRNGHPHDITPGSRSRVPNKGLTGHSMKFNVNHVANRTKSAFGYYQTVKYRVNPDCDLRSQTLQSSTSESGPEHTKGYQL